MNSLGQAIAWLLDPAHWAGSRGIGARLLEHLGYSALALVLAALIAIPLGVLIGHTGRGRALAVGLTGALRALPSLGVLTLLAVSLGLGIRQALVPSTIALVILAIPPLLGAAYAGVEAVDPDVVDGARAVGLREAQIALRVELPLAAPLLIGGIRSAALQVIATATISAFLGLGGLGRFILDGLAVRDYAQMLAGAVLVCALALLVDGLIVASMRITLPSGVRTALGTGLGSEARGSSSTATRRTP